MDPLLPNSSQLCEMVLHGFHLDVMVGGMLHERGKRAPDHSTRARVKKEMAKPRMSKSARIAQDNLKKGAHVEITVTAEGIKRHN